MSTYLKTYNHEIQMAELIINIPQLIRALGIHVEFDQIHSLNNSEISVLIYGPHLPPKHEGMSAPRLEMSIKDIHADLTLKTNLTENHRYRTWSPKEIHDSDQ